MQNKANLLDTQMNVSSVITKDYENKRLFRRGEKQTQSNPIADQPPQFSNFPPKTHIFYFLSFFVPFFFRPLSSPSTSLRVLSPRRPGGASLPDPSNPYATQAVVSLLSPGQQPQRSRRDSNPRYLSVKRFSRPSP